MSANDNTNVLLYPPLLPAELKDAHAYDDVERVVVTQHGVYLLSKGEGWVGVKPLSEINGGEMMERKQEADFRDYCLAMYRLWLDGRLRGNTEEASRVLNGFFESAKAKWPRAMAAEARKTFTPT